MFYALMTPTAHKTRTTTVDALGYQYDTYTSQGNINCYIVYNSNAVMQNNSLEYIKCDRIGYTSCNTVAIGDKVGDFLVSEVVPSRHGATLYLNKFENNAVV